MYDSKQVDLLSSSRVFSCVYSNGEQSMRVKFRLFLLVHERTLFRVMVVCVWFVLGVITYEVARRDPVAEFLSGRSDHLEGYGMGPVMSGLK